jgi:hypothetical protein
MTATDLAALIVTVASVVAVTLLVFGLITIQRTLRELRLAIEQLREETVPVVAELGEAVRTANMELERMDTLLGTAQSISGAVDSASRLAYQAFSNPVIKALALASGTGRAARTFRTEREEAPRRRRGRVARRRTSRRSGGGRR